MVIPKTSKILYVSDLGEHTRPVFRQAIAQARLHQAKLMMLHVVEPMSESAKVAIGTYLSSDVVKTMQQDGMKEILKTMRSRVQKFVEDECSGGICDLTPVEEIYVVTGRPSEEILRIAEKHGADMIVIGRSTLEIGGRKAMGSTARRVTRLSKIPVLIVPRNV